MKKFFAITIALTLMLSLCACGAQNSKDSSPSLSVTMQTLSQTCDSEDGGALLLKYSDDVPSVTIAGSEKSAQAINTALQATSAAYSKGSGEEDPGIDGTLALAKAQFADSPESFTGEYGAPYSMERSVAVARGDNAVLSFVYSAYSFSGGVHGLNTVYGSNYDVSTGSALKLADISDDEDGLKDYCVDYITQLTHGSDYINAGFNEGYEKSIKNIVADGAWYFSDDGLVFVANEYELGSYAAGSFRFTVPYSKLANYVKADYIPQTRSGGSADMSAAITEKAVSDSTVGSVVLDEAGEKITLTAKGSLYGVKLSHAVYSETNGSFTFTPGGTVLYFSDLASGQSIGVQTSIPDTIPNLMISWRAADGTQSKYLITQSGKDGSILLIPFGSSTDLNAVDITGKLPYSLDLDADNSDEAVALKAMRSEDSDMDNYVLTVTDGTASAEFETDIISDCSLWTADVDGDGSPELLLSGNVMSDDYVTYCWKYDGSKLNTVKFADDGGARSDIFSGWIKTIGSGGIELGKKCDVLGSYGGYRPFEYSGGVLSAAPGSVWSFTDNSQHLKVKSALPVTLSDGTSASLKPGDSILLTATDGQSWVSYEDSAGNTGTIAIEIKTDYWGIYIDGAEDSVYFDQLPYAG